MMIHQPPGNNRWIKYPKGEGPQVARELEVRGGNLNLTIILPKARRIEAYVDLPESKT
jgi:hypothetical protein